MITWVGRLVSFSLFFFKLVCLSLSFIEKYIAKAKNREIARHACTPIGTECENR